MERVTVWTDGACWPNPGLGGWAAVLLYESEPWATQELSGWEHENTTNNRMEVTAAVEALEQLPERCEVLVVSDSEYLVRGASKWLDGWKRRGWLTKGQRPHPVINRDLWERLDRAAQRHLVRWRWVRGHSGVEYNERADVMATEEAARAAEEAR